MRQRQIAYTSSAIVLICVLLFTVGCVCAPPMGSRSYQPISDWEKGEFDKANRYIYPDDVREDITKYQSTTIAWTGIIKKTEVEQTDEGPNIYYFLEHHYYDWIEDINPEQKIIWLSPRGEGTFMTMWGVTKETTVSEMEEFTEIGRLLIVYGTPVAVRDDGVIAIESSYIRVIAERYYTTEKLDYGRLTEPSETDK